MIALIKDWDNPERQKMLNQMGKELKTVYGE